MIIGIILFLIGVVGMFLCNLLSMNTYHKNNPIRAGAGLPPRPGTGDVPRWISGLYLAFRGLTILGIIVFILSLIII